MTCDTTGNNSNAGFCVATINEIAERHLHEEFYEHVPMSSSPFGPTSAEQIRFAIHSIVDVTSDFCCNMHILQLSENYASMTTVEPKIFCRKNFAVIDFGLLRFRLSIRLLVISRIIDCARKQVRVSGRCDKPVNTARRC